MQGYADPFNRGCYPWGEEDSDLVMWYRALGQLRAECPALRDGAFARLPGAEGVVAFTRGNEVLCAVNRTDTAVEIEVPTAFYEAVCRIGHGQMKHGKLHLPPLSAAVLRNK